VSDNDENKTKATINYPNSSSLIDSSFI